MNRADYLKLKYCPDEGWCNALKAGVLTVGAIVLVGLIHNISILIWSLFQLTKSG
jgi:hypothetical protein